MLGNHSPTSTASTHVVCSSSIPNTIRASRRAKAAPTQKCTPLPKVKWPLALLRLRRNSFGASKCAGSRFFRRSPHQQQMRIGGHLDSTERGVAHYVGVMTTKRRFIAQCLFDESTQQFGIVTDLLLDFGSIGENPRCASQK